MRKKKKIIAVSGGMDPLHIGHLSLLQGAKKLGDELVVILNNDNWLRKKKGRNFMSQQDRKKILQAIRCVDRVIITRHPQNPSDMSVCAELARIRPHIFANGGDRTGKNTPEKELCKKLGIKMAYNVGGQKVQSSSELLRRYHEHKNLRVA